MNTGCFGCDAYIKGYTPTDRGVISQWECKLSLSQEDCPKLKGEEDEKVFDIIGHRELWNWLADNSTKDKHDWPGWKDNGGKYTDAWAHCFACEYGGTDDEGDRACCPLEWSGTDQTAYACEEVGSPFFKWKGLNGNIETYHSPELAREIANLPVRKGVVTNEIREEE